MSERDWQKDWEWLKIFWAPEDSGDTMRLAHREIYDFGTYWLQRVQELEAENARLNGLLGETENLRRKVLDSLKQQNIRIEHIRKAAARMRKALEKVRETVEFAAIYGIGDDITDPLLNRMDALVEKALSPLQDEEAQS